MHYRALDVAYMAGIIDGEGHFYKPLVKNGRGESTRYARIVVTNTDRDLIDWMLNTFGGSASEMKKPFSHYKQCYSYRLQGKKAEEVAILVYPYLIVKRTQVKRII